jgi:hypothetical protein
MKIISDLQNGRSIDSLPINRRANQIVFTCIIPNGITGTNETEDTAISQQQPDYQKRQAGILQALSNITINIRLSGKTSENIIQNFNALEVAKISQTLGFPIVVKSVESGISVSFSIPLTLDRTSIPFSASTILYLSVKNAGATNINAYLLDSATTSTSNILRYEREIVQARQRKDYINTKGNYVIGVMENEHETEIHYETGEMTTLLPEEADVLNDFNSRCQLVWNNEQHSNFGNVTSILMFGVRKIAPLGTDEDKSLFFVRNITL